MTWTENAGKHIMNLALPVWNGRLSPVFDTARSLLVVEITGGRRIACTQTELGGPDPMQRVRLLQELEIRTLICGAVSRPLQVMIEAARIQVIPFVAGDTDRVIEAYLSGDISDGAFTMPGCGRGGFGRRRAQRRRCGRRGGRAASPWVGPGPE